MATSTRTISAKQLASAVDAAVKKASQRHNLQFDPAFSINGIINGRQLAVTAVDLNALRQVSSDIAAEASHAASTAMRTTDAAGAAAQLQFEPAVLIGKNHIICGWINPENLTITFE
jgi:hypothetical protein